MRTVRRPPTYRGHLMSRPLGVWLITIGIVGSGLLMSMVLAATYHDQGEVHISAWELGTAPFLLSFAAVASASAIGVHLRRPHARLGLIAAMATFSGWLIVETARGVLRIGAEFTQVLLSPRFWITIWLPAAICTALAALVWWYLYSKRTRVHFGG